MTNHCLPGHKLTPSQYAMKSNIEHFSNLIFQFTEQCLTHISVVGQHWTHTIGIGYPVHQYLSPRFLLLKDFSTGGATIIRSSSRWRTRKSAMGTHKPESSWSKAKRLSLRIRRGINEYLRWAVVFNSINVVSIIRIKHPSNTSTNIIPGVKNSTSSRRWCLNTPASVN